VKALKSCARALGFYDAANVPADEYKRGEILDLLNCLPRDRLHVMLVRCWCICTLRIQDLCICTNALICCLTASTVLKPYLSFQVDEVHRMFTFELPQKRGQVGHLLLDLDGVRESRR
jgi:hypothetical protein